MCDQCPEGHLHSWSARVSDRTKGTGCPQCIGRMVCKHNSLATKAPSVAAEWDYDANNGTPDDVTAHSSRSVHWHCAVCHNKWEATPNARLGKQRTGCPECARDSNSKTRIKHPTLAECQHPLLAEWDRCAPLAQQDSSTAGLQCPLRERDAASQAAHSVLAGPPANATPCRRCTLT